MTYFLTLNTGSSSVKFALYKASSEPERYIYGQVESLGLKARFVLQLGQEKHETELREATHQTAVSHILTHIEPYLEKEKIIGIGHRIVHGGREFYQPTLLTPDVLQKLETLIPLVPLHQPYSLALIHAAIRSFPGVPQIGCFDTAFHSGKKFVDEAFALPRHYYDEGIRRYGFHGLSYEFISQELKQSYPDIANKRVVIAHLGNGASMCAIKNGRSINASTGFSAVDGLPMGTRCGRLDPGVILYLMEEKRLSTKEISNILYKRSGLLGLSDEASDMAVLEHSEELFAKQAIQYFTYQVRREVGAMAASLEGIDALVFSAGIGEHSARVRAAVCEPLAFLGIRIDAEKNNRNEADIGVGPVKVLVVPTNEEQVIARGIASLCFPT